MHAPSHRLTSVATLAVVALLFVSIRPADAQESPFEVGAIVGLNRSILTAPADATNAPSFLSGTAFNGFGVAFGARGRYRLHPYIAVAAELALSYDRAVGFEVMPDWRREMRVATWRARLPITLVGTYEASTWRVDAGLGPELVLPLWVSGELDEIGVPVDQRFDLAIDAATQLGVAFDLGAAFVVAPDMRATTNLRLSWLSGVGETSVDRFDGYVSPTEPGAFVAAFDWTFLWSVGMSWAVL